MLKADCELLRLAAQHLIQLCNSNQIKSVIGICSKTLLKHPRESLQHTHLCKQKKQQQLHMNVHNIIHHYTHPVLLK